ncbi:MAG: peroxide stress protein YaaA [Moraxellaceae bacterium]|nr:peroxide stress protein YaaA [Moraxellaceae bacterium]
MLLVISPAKSLDTTSKPTTRSHTQPDFLEQSQTLIDVLRGYDPAGVASLMDLSDELAALNVGRYASWQPPFTTKNAKQAALMFDGDVYDGLQAPAFTAPQLKFAQRHLRILSGLYGLLRPLDLIQPYRLEMGTRLPTPAGKDLYAFWGDTITEAVNTALADSGSKTLVNLASDEYFKSVKPKKLDGRVITPVFQDWKSGQYKIISFFAKRARGLMSRYAITNGIRKPDALKAFDLDGYAFTPEASDADTWVFRRRLAD